MILPVNYLALQVIALYGKAKGRQRQR